MSEKQEELLKKPLYVFDLPHELLVSIAAKDPSLLQPIPETASAPSTNTKKDWQVDDKTFKTATSCLLCNTSFANVQEQRQHSRSDWHNYNLKQKLRGGKAVDENEFEKLVEELEESLSGSGSESSESEDDGLTTRESTLTALLKKQAKLSNGDGKDEELLSRRKKKGPGNTPLAWFSTPLLPTNTSLGIYRALFTNAEQERSSLVDVLQQKQLRPLPAKASTDGSGGVSLASITTTPSIFMCMVGGGHFAGMIVSLAPKILKHPSSGEQRQAIVIAHKTFHRYTTRRKQGGGQSANDAAKGAAHSAGSSLRRYNEVALEQEIRALLAEWKEVIGNCDLIFVRATGSSNRRILFGPYDGQVLHHQDPRNRTFPFSTRRATQSELMRSFVELTRVKVSHVDQAALAVAAATAQAEADKQAARPKVPTASAKPSKEEEVATLHTNQLQAMVRRSKASALLSYLTANNLSPDYSFHPLTTKANHHAPTPLLLAASSNAHHVVLALLTKAGADPTLPSSEGRVPFELAGDRSTRDAFRVARSELGEGKWNWTAAKVPSALSKVEADERDAREKAEAEKEETARRRAEEERLKKQGPVAKDTEKSGKTLTSVSVSKTAEEKREEEGRGMTPEMRARLERERRARAAEARMRLFGSGGTGR